MSELLKQVKFLFEGTGLGLLCLLFIFMLGGAGLEVAGVGIILPFIALLNDETILNKSPKLLAFYHWLQPESMRQFLQWSILVVIGFFILKNAYLYISVIIQNRFLKRMNSKFAGRLFRSYLCCPYSLSLERNSAQQIRNLTIVGSVVQGLVYPVLTLITESVVAIAVFALVVWTSPGPAIFVGSMLFVAIGLFYSLVRRRLANLGGLQNVYYERLMQTMQQGLGSAKETRILGREDFFAQEYDENLESVLEASRIQGQLAQLPRFYIETAVVSILSGMIAWFFYSGEDSGTIVSSASIFAVAAIRLMPGFARISASLNSIRFYTPGLNEVYQDLVRCEALASFKKDHQELLFPFKREILIEGVSFRYNGAKEESLQDVTIQIKKYQMIGFAGTSGAGKTTLIDIILGLLSPTKGRVLVDGENISTNIRGWQRQFGYIPQQIYLMDDTVRKNIGFGLNANDIVDSKIWRALELAQLAEFVRGLPDGLNTFIGERGTRLSGGQRQRIGIARALYHEPEILVMDEATAALDNETERMFMEALMGLAGKKTILFIAHRLTTLERCDVIFCMSEGRVVASGNYQSLFANPSDSNISKAGHRLR